MDEGSESLLGTKLKSAAPLVIAKEWSKENRESSSMPTLNSALEDEVDIAPQAEEITESTPTNHALAFEEEMKVATQAEEIIELE